MVKRTTNDAAPAEHITQADIRPGSNATAALLNYVERFERLTEEIDALSDDRKEVMAEVKSTGFDTKILRKVIQRRKMDAADRMECDALLELYEEMLAEAEKRQTQQSIDDGE